MNMTKYKSNKIDFVDSLDKLFAEVNPTDALILTAGAIAGMKGYTPISAMINSASGLAEGKAAGALYGIDPVLKGALTYGAAFAGLPGIFGSYFTMWTKPKEDMTVEEKSEWERSGDLIALAAIGMIEAYAITRPGVVQGIGEIAKGIGEMIPG